MNLVESLVSNKRYIGALSFLLKPDYYSTCNDTISYGYSLMKIISEDVALSASLKHRVTSQLTQKLNEFIATLSLTDYVAFTHRLIESNLIEEAANYLAIYTPNSNTQDLKLPYDNVLVSLLSDQQINEEVLAELSVAELRALGGLAERLSKFESAAILGDRTCSIARDPFWDYHFTGLQYSRISKINDAFNFYSKFLDTALNRNDRNAIKTGYLRYLECRQQLNLEELVVSDFDSKIPKDVMNSAEVLSALSELADINNFRESIDLRSNQKLDVGYKALLTTENVYSYIEDLERDVGMKPNFHAFYELYKCYAIVGNPIKAKKYLKLATDFNYFLFQKYEC
ncbi:hypothetical protein Q4561_12645 [Alteromonas sp. 1_MG-2023]|uniref:hypothetical protein n=1 Tax=Alteromonas sp. 1_MG-2023 TaxID=3062669 RepID=UPI0026E141AD|nr:hypothetical protein [Alteromonas sp. 1_MG-2023]MDO6567912.1 hypothetical protein [Alteromonas sp. 1_MG-2023]